MARNEYDDIYDATMGNQTTALQESMFVASKQNPDQAAQSIKLSNKTGIPVDVVNRNPEQANQSSVVDSFDYEYIVNRTPGLAKWLTDSANSSVGHDDINNLGEHETKIKEYNLLQVMYRSLQAGSAAADAGYARMPAGMADLGLLPGNVLLKATGQGEKQQRSPDWLRNNAVAKYYDAQEEAWHIPELDKSITAQAMKGDFAGAGRSLVAQLFYNAPQQAMIILSAMAGNPTAGLATAGALQGSQANKIAQESGADPAAATIDAVSQGSLEMLLERAGTFGVFKRWENAIAKTAGKESARQVLKEFGKTMAYSAVAEGNEEFWTQMGQDFSDYATGVNPDALNGMVQRAVDQGLVGSASGVSMTSPAALASGINRARKLRETENTKNFYLSLGDTAEASKVRERLPESHQKYLQEITKGTLVENVYIPVEAWEAYMVSKGIEPAAAANEIGISKEYDQARETGRDIKILLADFTNKLVGTEHYKGLADDIKFDPNADTARQAKDEDARIKADVEAQNKAAAEKEQKIEDQKKAEEIKSVIGEQLKATGKYSDKDVKHLSELASRAYSVFGGIRQGKDPLEYFKQNFLDIKNADNLEEAQGQTTMSQDSTDYAKIVEQAGGTFTKITDLKNSLYEDEPTIYMDFPTKSGKAATITIRPSEFTPEGIAAKIAKNENIIKPTTLFQSAQRETPEFKKWFGDSKVVDEKGNPLVVYHGTANTFSEFKKSTKKTKNSFDRDSSAGIYFSDSPDQSEYFARAKAAQKNTKLWEMPSGQQIYPVYLSMENPLEYDFENKFKEPDVIINISKQAKKQGHDGVILKNVFDAPIGKPATVYLVFKPTQIKSAIGNSGAFDPNNPNILMQEEKLGPLGAIIFGKKGTFNIRLLKDANYSTFIHELGHGFLELLSRAAAEENAPQEIQDMSAAVLKWLGVDSWDQVTKKQHEQWARGFEKYLGEGVAPSDALRKAFARFKLWMISVYKALTNLNVELSDDIRNVFDRMIASDEEITQAQVKQNMTPMILDPVSVLGEERGGRYIAATIDAKQSAEQTILTKLMKDFKQEEEAWWKEQWLDVRHEIVEELNNNKVFVALAALEKGTLPDGTPYPEGQEPPKLSSSIVKAEYGKRFNLPKKMFSKDGIHPSIAAEMFGFASGEALLEALSGEGNLKEAIDRQADERMRQLYPDLLIDANIEQEAIAALHNTSQEQVLRMELEYLAEQNKPVLKDLIRTVAKRIPSTQIVRKYAEQTINETPVKDISPYQFQLAERRNAKLAGEALAKGDFDAAFEAKRKELLNYELYRYAVEAREEISQSIENFKKIAKADEKLGKTRDLDYVNVARAVLAKYGIGESVDNPMKFLEQTKEYDADTYETLAALVEDATTGAGNWADVPFEQFMAMKEAVDAIWDISRRSRQIQIDDKKMDLDEIRGHLMDRIKDLVGSKKTSEYTKTASENDKIAIALLSARAAGRRVESWADAIDGTDGGGWFKKSIWYPIAEGAQKFRIVNKTYTQKFLDLIKPIEKTLTAKEIVSDELRHIFRSKAELLGALLHTGNESNLSKLLRGRNWGQFDENGNLDTSRWDAFIARMQEEGILTKEDYDFIQSVWDLFNELKPAAQKAHKEMYGHYFKSITADEFMTPWGKYRGGYAPAIVDPFASEDAAIRQEKQAAESTNNSYMFPSTGRGFSKTRIERYAAPLAMDLRLVPQHINKVLRFTNIEPRIKDVGRIVRNQEFREVLRDLDPTVGQHMLSPWLQRAALQMVENPDKSWTGWKMWREIRTRTGVNIMAANVVNTLQQFTGLSIAAVKVKPMYLRNALWQYMGHPKETADMVHEKSEYMQTRTTTQIMEIQKTIDDIILNQGKFDKARDFAKQHAYFMQQGTQNFVDMVVWPAAYDQSIAQGNTDKQAIRDADEAVRLTQGDFSAENISGIESGNAFARAFLMFYSYFNMQANLLGTEFSKNARDLGLKRGAGRALYIYAFGFMIPAVVSELIMRALSGQSWDKDDDGYLDDVLAIFFGSQFRTATAMFPFAGQAVQAGVNTWNNKFYDDRISASPAISMIESAVSAPHSVYKAIADDGNKKKAIRDVMSALGLLTGLPIAPLSRPLGYLADVNDGNIEPQGSIDFIRGLATGKGDK